MISARDPAQMAPEDRVAELAIAFANGYLRLLLSRKKELALAAESEPSCALVGGAENAPGKGGA